MKIHVSHRALAYVLTGMLTLGSISVFPPSVSAAEPVIEDAVSTVTSGMFASERLDNTWLFGGGIETQGRFEEIGGVRNYIGQFEEYVRWEKRVNSVREGMQRYTINAGRAGQDAEAFAARLGGLISQTQPMAVSYLIGPEDYSKGSAGLSSFEDAVYEIVTAALAMKEQTGYAVIQLPHAVNDAQANANASLYAQAARDLITDIALEQPDDAGRIAVVDHFSQTEDGSFTDTMLTDEGLLNANGHLALARQFSEEIYGSADNFTSITDNWTAVDAPEGYTNAIPQATASSNGLRVSVPASVNADSWRYILETDAVTITGSASQNPFLIDRLPAGCDYRLTVCTGDGKTQLRTTAGTIAEGNTSAVPAADNALAQAIQDKVHTADSLTWLFMGDSITHGAAHTHGYDSVPQLFEKYVKEDLGRTDDIVINTAVSGATTDRTLENIEQRMTKYRPDIVSVMLGTNDTINEAYRTKLEAIVTAIREANPDALILFRSPTPAKSDNYAAKLPGENGSVALMKAAAEADGSILFIDQYTDWNAEISAYPYLFGSAFYFGDGNIHPGAAGQLRMAKQFIRACGLNTDTRIANLTYAFTYEEESSELVPPVTVSADNGVTIRKSDLQDAYETGTIGDLTVVFEDADGRTYTKHCGLDETEANITVLPVSRRYTVTVTALLKGSTPKRVTFAPQEIMLATGTEAADLKAALDKHSAVRNGDLSVYTAESAAAFSAAFDAAKKASDDQETDAEKLSRLCLALEQAAMGLAKKPAPIQPPTPPDQQQQKDPAPVPQPAPAITNGYTFRSGSYHYKITDSSRLTVTVTGTDKKNSKKLSVPDSVALEGNAYTVTAIADSAFKSCKAATSAVIGKNIKEIGKQAFAGCTKLQTVNLKAKNLKKIGSKAFFNCKSLNKITLKSTSLKTIGKNAFYGIGKKCVIKVPTAKLKSYKKLLSKKGQSKGVTIKK